MKAFVGHSFTDDDKVVVAEFLKFFDQIKGLVPHFSWEHAEAAEPRELRQKVLSLIEGKNVFIGICTAKEEVIAPALLQRVPFLGRQLMAKADGFDCKTSDWIIQEIGLAVGRGMELILLVEDGVRRPGGLQGDVEYIPFSRSQPEKAFGKITEMIKALSPRPALIAVASGEGVPSKPAEQPSVGIANSDLDPKPGWTMENYRRAMLRLLFTNDAEGADRISSAYLAMPESHEGAKAAEWMANREYFNFVVRGSGDIGKLRELAQAHPDNAEIASSLAGALSYYDEHAEAAEIYDALSVKAKDADAERNYVGNASIDYARANRFDLAHDRIDRLRSLTSDDIDSEKHLISTIRMVAEASEDTDAAIATMERLVELDPSDTSTRFDLAHLHADSSNEDMALYHYLKIPVVDRKSGAWNNIGVSFDQFKMPGKAVSAYRRSESEGETLAMSNLAQKLTSAGFFEEAQAILDRAVGQIGYHQNVASAIAALKGSPEEEDKREEELLKKLQPKIEFFRRMGRAVMSQNLQNIPTTWKGPHCRLTVSISGDRFTAMGSYEQPVNALAAAIAPSWKDQTTRYRIDYSGVIRGRLIEATVQREREGEASSATSLLGIPSQPKVLMIISEFGKTIEVAERPYTSSPSYYEFRLEE